MARTPTTSDTPRKRAATAAVKVAPGVAVETTPPTPAKKKPIWTHLYFQVLVAIALGALIGHFWP
ncbi:MAG: hypothetical protein ACXW3K_09220, partial [Brevundimonas sp.]